MRTKFSGSLAFVVATLFCLGSTTAQDGAGTVTVLDVAKVFQKNLEFDQRMQAIRNEAEQLKRNIQNKQEQIRLDAQQLQGLDPNSQQAKQLELTLEQRHTALRTEARQGEADLLVREARVYHETYQKMQSIVTKFATENGIAIVLRFDSAPIDPENRGDVVKGVNRTVVYHSGMDITRWIIEAMGPQVSENAANPGSTLR